MSKDFKGYLEYIVKDATLLSVAIMMLFIENVYQYTYGKSLLNQNEVDYEQLLHFKSLFGFVIFLFACKPLFILFYHLINLLPLYKLEFSTPYKVGFGCFVLSILLFFHAWTTNSSNSFLNALPNNGYRYIAVLLGLIALLFASICNWSGNESKETAESRVH